MEAETIVNDIREHIANIEVDLVEEISGEIAEDLNECELILTDISNNSTYYWSKSFQNEIYSIMEAAENARNSAEKEFLNAKDY